MPFINGLLKVGIRQHELDDYVEVFAAEPVDYLGQLVTHPGRISLSGFGVSSQITTAGSVFRFR